ncbi:unnamed protein product, partial [Phaeothamnion confervicola]
SGVGAISLGSIDNTASSTGMNLTSGTSITFNGDSKIIGLIAYATNGITVDANLTIPSLGTILDADNGGDGTGTFTLNAGKTLTIIGSESFITAADLDIFGSINSTVQVTIANTKNNVQLGAGTVVASDMNISNAELAAITASTLKIKGVGNITIDGVAAASTTNLGNVYLLGTSVLTTGGASTFKALQIDAVQDINLDANLAITTGDGLFYADTDFAGGGNVSIGAGKTLSYSGA